SVRRQCTRAKSEQKRKIQVNNNWRYFKAECRKNLLEEKTGSIYRKRKIDVEPVFGHLKAHLAFHRFHLRGKQGATIDIGLALMALNLRKLGKYMERKVRKTEKISSILTINIKIELIFFLRKNYCPTLFLSHFSFFKMNTQKFYFSESSVVVSSTSSFKASPKRSPIVKPVFSSGNS
ncbi:transposase, partial [Enterococcus hirae]